MFPPLRKADTLPHEIGNFTVFPISFANKPDLEYSDKVLLPPLAFDQVNIYEPMTSNITLLTTFRIHSPRTKKNVVCVPLDYTAEMGTIYMPLRLMSLLDIAQGEIVNVCKNIILPARSMVLRPHTYKFIEAYNDPVLFLEQHLVRSYSTIVQGSVISIPDGIRVWDFTIVSMNPPVFAHLIDTDVKLSLDQSPDYHRYEEITSFKQNILNNLVSNNYDSNINDTIQVPTTTTTNTTTTTSTTTTSNNNNNTDTSIITGNNNSNHHVNLPRSNVTSNHINKNNSNTSLQSIPLSLRPGGHKLSMATTQSTPLSSLRRTVSLSVGPHNANKMKNSSTLSSPSLPINTFIGENNDNSSHNKRKRASGAVSFNIEAMHDQQGGYASANREYDDGDDDVIDLFDPPSFDNTKHHSQQQQQPKNIPKKARITMVNENDVFAPNSFDIPIITTATAAQESSTTLTPQTLVRLGGTHDRRSAQSPASSSRSPSLTCLSVGTNISLTSKLDKLTLNDHDTTNTTRVLETTDAHLRQYQNNINVFMPKDDIDVPIPSYKRQSGHSLRPTTFLTHPDHLAQDDTQTHIDHVNSIPQRSYSLTPITTSQGLRQDTIARQRSVLLDQRLYQSHHENRRKMDVTLTPAVSTSSSSSSALYAKPLRRDERDHFVYWYDHQGRLVKREEKK